MKKRQLQLIDGPKKVLIVDDETAFLMSIKRILEKTGFIIDTAETIDEAMALLVENRFHAVVTDLRLTNILSREGFEILKYVKENKAGTSVVILTGYGNPETMEKAYTMGADLYLEKPVSINILKSILDNFCRQ